MDILFEFQFLKHLIVQALEESGIGTIDEIKTFYTNDIIHYYRQTYKKVSKLYDEYKAKKLADNIEKSSNLKNEAENINLKNEHDLKLEQFMKDNDL